MFTASALGASPIQSPVPPAPAQTGGAAAPVTPAKAAAVPAQTRVSLSQQGLAALPDLPENAVSELAQGFLGNVGAAVLASSAEDANSAFDLSASTRFAWRGQVGTADGQSFEFEIEARYEANTDAESSQARPAEPGLTAPAAVALAGVHLPEIKFPGSLNDLFKVLGRELNIPAHNPAHEDEGAQGNLMLRLQRLVDSAALLAPRAHENAPAQDFSKALASSYGK